MGFSIGKIASVASSIASKADMASSLGNINLGSLNPSNIGSLKGTIESAINGKMSSITSELESSISVGDIESMTKDFDIESKTKQLQSQLEGTASMPNIDESQIQSMVDGLGLQDIGNLGLSDIKYM